MYSKITPERTHLPIGSEVQIYSISWYNLNADKLTGIVDVGLGFSIEMREYCSKTTKIVEYDEFTHTYELAIDGRKNRWSEEMFKAVVKKDMIQEMKDYFNNTPKEKIKEDWDKLAKYDEVGPTAKEYLAFAKKRINGTLQ